MQNCLIVIGAAKQPVDGVGDYAHCLSDALVCLGHNSSVVNVGWDVLGRWRALLGFARKISKARPDWIIVNHTNLAWSRWGLPAYLLPLVILSRVYGACVGLVLHDPSGFGGSRLRDRLRTIGQIGIMWLCSRIASRTLLTVVPSVVPWVSGSSRRFRFLPVGSNIPALEESRPIRPGASDGLNVLVFGFSPNLVAVEVEQLCIIASKLKEIGIDVTWVLAGRCAVEASSAFSDRMDNQAGVEGIGFISGEDLSKVFRSVDLQMELRDCISSRRGSVIAGMAHGLPIVGFEGRDTGWPMTTAGIMLHQRNDLMGIVAAVKELSDNASYRGELARRNRRVYEELFSWERIASSLVAIMVEGGVANEETP